jgi:hypothetical protein
VGVATLGSPLYCIAQGEKGLLLVGVVAVGGSVSFPLDCLETEDRPLLNGEDGMFPGRVFTEVVVGVWGVAAALESATPADHIC